MFCVRLLMRSSSSCCWDGGTCLTKLFLVRGPTTSKLRELSSLLSVSAPQDPWLHTCCGKLCRETSRLGGPQSRGLLGIGGGTRGGLRVHWCSGACLQTGRDGSKIRGCRAGLGLKGLCNWKSFDKSPADLSNLYCPAELCKSLNTL